MTRLSVAAIAALACLFAPPVLAGAAANGREQAERPQAVSELIERMAKDDFNGFTACRSLIEIGGPAVPGLIRATQHDVPRVRYWSIAALSAIGDEEAVPAIKQLLDDPEPVVRAVAVWHLGRWFDRPDVREAVVEKLRDTNRFVKGWAMKLLQAKKYRQAAGEVRALMEDATPEVRYDALHTLAVLEGRDALATMKKVLREDESALVRECAVRCCTVIEPPTPRTADVLISALRDADEEVRKAAVKLLRKGFAQYFGFDPGAEPLQREKAVREWRDWYEANGARLRWNEPSRRFEAIEATPPAQPPER